MAEAPPSNDSKGTPAVESASARHRSSETAPRLTLRVGVTGHRPNKLDPEKIGLVTTTAAMILSGIKTAAETIRKRHQSVFSPESPQLRLVTLLAEGADTICARAAVDCGYRLDVVLPFPRAAYAEAQQFCSEARAIFDGFLQDEARNSALELDGNPDDPGLAQAGYLEAGRLMVMHSDIVIAIWNGRPESGIGGTAQIVREAVEQGTPVVWIRTDSSAVLLTTAEQWAKRNELPALAPSDERSPGGLVQTVDRLVSPPTQGTSGDNASPHDARGRLEQFLAEPERKRSRCIAYDAMRRLLIGTTPKCAVEYRVDQDTKEAWIRFRNRAKEIGGQGFASSLETILETRWRLADNIALHYSNYYRSAYVLNFTLAAAAVIVGMVSIFPWSAENSLFIKAVCVAFELLLISAILILTSRGRRGNWHTKWLEARSVAELLRSTRTLALVARTADSRGSPGNREDTWVEWYVRSTLREIAPPSGTLNAAVLRTAITSALEDEIEGQIAYNTRTKMTNHRMHHRLHALGDRLFKLTLFAGSIYLLVFLIYWADCCPTITDLIKQYKDLVKGVTTFLGACLPAVGAALFGIHATGDFRAASEQAARTSLELEALKLRLQTERDAPELRRTSQLLLSLSQALTSDLRDWATLYRMRELTLPG